MKNKKIIINVIQILLIFIIFIGFTSNCVNAQIIGDLGSWKPPAINEGDVTNLNALANKIIGYIRVTGSVASVIAIIIIGIKYMVGSVEEKAEYKKTMKPYLIGAILVFGITNILGIIEAIVREL